MKKVVAGNFGARENAIKTGEIARNPKGGGANGCSENSTHREHIFIVQGAAAPHARLASNSGSSAGAYLER